MMMNKDYFFEKMLFPSDSSFGDNSKEIDRIWDIYLKYRDGNEIACSLLDSMLDVKENFQVFASDNTNYMKTFGCLELNISLPDADLIHELGHFYYNQVLSNQISIDFESINQRARDYSRTVSDASFSIDGETVINGNFRSFIKELCREENSFSENRDNIGPFSDLVNAIHLGISRFQTKEGELYVLPYGHSEEYYEMQEGKVNYPLLFDEQFANFFTLTIMNKTAQLNCLKTFFGDEWFSLMTNTLLSIENILKERRENKKVL